VSAIARVIVEAWDRTTPRLYDASFTLRRFTLKRRPFRHARDSKGSCRAEEDDPASAAPQYGEERGLQMKAAHFGWSPRRATSLASSST